MHTPAPWTIETVKTSCGICHKIGPFPGKPHRPDKPTHACVYVDYPGNGTVEAELLANARLIAAAPTLFNMVRWCVNHDGECLGDHPELLEAARAAIALLEP